MDPNVYESKRYNTPNHSIEIGVAIDLLVIAEIHLHELAQNDGRKGAFILDPGSLPWQSPVAQNGAREAGNRSAGCQ